MKIVHVCRVAWPDTGGMEAMVLGLAEAQRARGHTVWIVSLTPSLSTAALRSDGRTRGVSVARVPWWGSRRYPLPRGLVRRMRGADLVHAHGLDGVTDVAVWTRRWHGARVGVSTHGGYLHTHWMWPVKQVWLRSGTRATLRRADAVWFTSESDRRALSPAGVQGEVVENGVDVRDLLELERRPVPGRWVVVGRIDRHKGLEDLVRLLARPAGRGLRIELVGPVSDRAAMERLEHLARDAGVIGRMGFHGAVDRSALREHLSRAEGALFPSRYEGFGLAVVEAMAAGVPVVARDIPAFRHLLGDGRAGWLVDFERPEEVARCMARVSSEPQRVARAEQVARDYGWERRVDVWEDAYRCVFERGGER